MRKVAWFSAGAASAVAAKMSNPDVIAYCQTNSEDSDNARFMADCEQWFGQEVLRLHSDKYFDTWHVWESRKYIAGIDGAPCTGELKIKPREAFQGTDDVHVFGYTADYPDVRRADALREHWPALNIETPLIDAGLNKAACLAMIEQAGIALPRVYALGFPNANCIPCCKATSPDYWALVREHYPDKFKRMAELSRRLGARLARINGERCFIDEIPDDWPAMAPLAPACDMLCQMAEL